MNQDHQPENGAPESSPVTLVDNKASLIRRLLAGIVDLFLVNFFVTPLLAYSIDVEAIAQQPFNLPPEVAVQILAHSVFVFFVLNGYLLYRRGQTLGKRLFNIAIVDLNNQPVSILNLVVNRYLIQVAMMVVPLLNPVDYLTMFLRRDRRCLHDLMAKTKVIDLKVKVNLDHKSMIA